MRKFLVLNIVFASLLLVLTGCSHSFKYTKPAKIYDVQNSITVDKPQKQVWDTLVSSVSQNFFVINNIDKESGLINVSYVGSPEQFVDCGKMFSRVANLAGERIYDFSAAEGYKEYELWNGGPIQVKRKMELDGRINILVQEVSQQQTKVIVHAKYILTKSLSMLTKKDVGYSSFWSWDNSSESMSFTTEQGSGIFDSQMTECACNGKLESSILDIFNNQVSQSSTSAQSPDKQKKLLGYQIVKQKDGTNKTVPVYE